MTINPMASNNSTNRNPCMPTVWKLGEANSVVTVESSRELQELTDLCGQSPADGVYEASDAANQEQWLASCLDFASGLD